MSEKRKSAYVSTSENVNEVVDGPDQRGNEALSTLHKGNVATQDQYNTETEYENEEQDEEEEQLTGVEEEEEVDAEEVEEEEEEESDDEEKVYFKVTKHGAKHSKIMEISHGLTFKKFQENLAASYDINVENLLICFKGKDQDDIEVDQKTFKHLVNKKWPMFDQIIGTGNDVIKLTVSDRAALLTNSSDSATEAFTKALSNVPQFLSPGATQEFSHVDKPVILRNLGTTCTVNLSRMETEMPIVLLQPNVELQWTKINLLGKGAFGTVYEGLTNDGKLIAVKVMELPLDNAENKESEDVKSLMSTIKLMSHFKHKHIVSYYGCQMKETENGGKVFEIFLEDCQEGSLTSLRKKYDKIHGKLSIQLARYYTRQILIGLKYLHDNGVTHRDIKSDNVLIGASGDAKLADFGCSKKIATAAMGSHAVDQNQDCTYQTMCGTPLFMAPEVLSESGSGYGRPADIWSVGCLLLELLGCLPWKLSGTNSFQIMYQIAQSKQMPTGIPTNCPKLLYNFFETIFERNPSKRATCDELLKHPWMSVNDQELEEVPDDDN